MPNLTGLGEQYFLTLAQGGFSSAYSTGYDRLACIDNADTIIGTPIAITWGWSSGKANLYINEFSPIVIPAGTTVSKIALFNSGVRNNGTFGAPDIAFSTSGSLEYADSLAIEQLSPLQVFTDGGTVDVESLTYNFRKIEL